MEHLTIILTLLFLSCGSKIDTKIEEQRVVESVNVEKSSPQITEFYIKDESQYSSTFLEEFKAKHSIYETVALIEDTIIINNDRENFILIPTDLPLDRVITYQESANDVKYTLMAKRINFSTIEYIYFETVNGKKKNEKQGQADLEPVFYFGAEGTFEDKNENVYGMNEYITFSNDDCQTLIYVGVGSIEKSFMKQNCKSEKTELETPLLVIVE